MPGEAAHRGALAVGGDFAEHLGAGGVRRKNKHICTERDVNAGSCWQGHNRPRSPHVSPKAWQPPCGRMWADGEAVEDGQLQEEEQQEVQLYIQRLVEQAKRLGPAEGLGKRCHLRAQVAPGNLKLDRLDWAPLGTLQSPELKHILF